MLVVIIHADMQHTFPDRSSGIARGNVLGGRPKSDIRAQHNRKQHVEPDGVHQHFIFQTSAEQSRCHRRQYQHDFLIKEVT